MPPAEFAALMQAASMLRQQHPGTPAREVLDAVMRVPPGSTLKADPVLRLETAWLAPRSGWAELLREAFAPEVEDDYLLLLDDPDPEVRAMLEELWQRTVIRRFGRRYLGWEA